MLWVTRFGIRVNRAATGWLVRRFIDPAATFRFVDPGDVARIQQDDGGLGFDAPGASYPHKDSAGRCSFETLSQQYRPGDRALRELSRIVHWADFPDEMSTIRPEAVELPGTFDRVSLAGVNREHHRETAMLNAVGLRTISRGFPLVTADDHETLERSGFLYDALYASLRERFGQ